MHRLRRTLALFLVLASLPATTGVNARAADAPAKIKKVLFLGIDGCRFDAVQAADVPNLDRLMADGCYDADCQILGDAFRATTPSVGPAGRAF